jgi:CRISPR-associated protein Cas5t
MMPGLTDRLVGKVVIEAPTASFRHPHFLIAKQLTFDAPPPSTIHGLLAAALGDYPDPASFEFAYTFTARRKATDLEHQHVIYAQGGKFESAGDKHPKNIEGSVQPYLREFLFQTRLELYLDPPELADIFLSPAFCLSLGRSQDLAAVLSVERTTLPQSQSAYLENTLLPFSDRPYLPQGTTLMMPSYIGPAPERRATFQRYIHLRTRIFAGEVLSGDPPALNWTFFPPPEPRSWWIDPVSPLVKGLRRAVVFHRLGAPPLQS